MPRGSPICIAKCLYCNGDDLLENLLKTTAQKCKKSPFGLTEILNTPIPFLALGKH